MGGDDDRHHAPNRRRGGPADPGGEVDGVVGHPQDEDEAEGEEEKTA